MKILLQEVSKEDSTYAWQTIPNAPQKLRPFFQYIIRAILDGKNCEGNLLDGKTVFSLLGLSRVPQKSIYQTP